MNDPSQWPNVTPDGPISAAMDRAMDVLVDALKAAGAGDGVLLVAFVGSETRGEVISPVIAAACRPQDPLRAADAAEQLRTVFAQEGRPQG